MKTGDEFQSFRGSHVGLIGPNGSGYLQLIGFGWPLLLGLGTGWSAWRKFKSSDLV